MVLNFAKANKTKRVPRPNSRPPLSLSQGRPWPSPSSFSAPVAKQVSPPILRATGQTPARTARIDAVDKTDAIARPGRRLHARTPKAEEDGTGAIRRLTRLDARQQHGIIRGRVPQREIAPRRARRLYLQRRGRRRRSHGQRALLLLLLPPFFWGIVVVVVGIAVVVVAVVVQERKLAAAGERDRAEPAAVRQLAIRACLQGRV